MFGFIKDMLKKEVSQQLDRKVHEHHKYVLAETKPFYPEYFPPEYSSIDDAVIHLIKDSRNKSKLITELQSQLAAIHAHYRSELCNDCCHSEVCKLRPNVKYGFECEDKAYELEVELFEVEPEKVETEKEEANEGL